MPARSYLSQVEPLAHFGLGADAIESLRVTGADVTFTDEALGDWLKGDEAEPITGPQDRPVGGVLQRGERRVPDVFPEADLRGLYPAS